MSYPLLGERLARLARLGRRLGEREKAEAEALGAAWRVAEGLHAAVEEGLGAFHAAAGEAGACHLRVELSKPRVDDKHLRSVQFDLRRGAHEAIVTVKSRGDVTLVGPLRAGVKEGPCRTLPFPGEDAAGKADLHEALGGFLERFLEAAAAP